MKIIFIKPPQTHLYDPFRNPPLGLMYVAAVAKGMGHDVSYADFSASPEDTDFLSLLPQADMYALTVSILDYEFCNLLASRLKERRQCLVIFGGVFTTTAPDRINRSVVDSLIVGEGESSFQRLLDDVTNGKQPAWEYSSPRIADLDSILFPYRNNLIHFMSRRLVKEGVLATTIITSRGCPFSCNFCAS